MRSVHKKYDLFYVIYCDWVQIKCICFADMKKRANKLLLLQFKGEEEKKPFGVFVFVSCSNQRLKSLTEKTGTMRKYYPNRWSEERSRVTERITPIHEFPFLCVISSNDSKKAINNLHNTHREKLTQCRNLGALGFRFQVEKLGSS